MARLGRKDRGLVERNGKWWVRLYHLGREHWFGPHENKGDARAFYENAKKEQREERFDPARYHRRRRKITLKDWITQLEALTVGGAPGQRRYGRWWIKVWGKRHLDEITTADLQKLQAQLLNKGKKAKAPATINRYYAAIRHWLYLAVRDGKLDKNPVAGVKFFKEPEGRVRFLTEGEEKRLREVMSPEDWALVAFALHTGLRRGEQFGLKWRYVDMDNGVLTIPRSKSGETRHVQLNEEAVRILRGLGSWMTSPWVFPSPSPARAKDAQNFYNRTFLPALQRAGIQGAVWHTLRHTFASRLVMAGVDLRTVQELMGHKDISMTIRYSHLSPGHLREAVGRLVNSLNSLNSQDATTDRPTTDRPVENPQTPVLTVTKTGNSEEQVSAESA